MLFFFFKQKTAYEMRISDWSSDVCSSDLYLALADDPALIRAQIEGGLGRHEDIFGRRPTGVWAPECSYRPAGPVADPTLDRTSVVEGKSVSVRVDLGGSRLIKQKKTAQTNIQHEQLPNSKHRQQTQ